MALAVLLLPLGLWRLSVRQQDALAEPNLNRCRTILKPWQFSASVKAGHPAPEVSLNWLHASVTGVVPSLADRESIRQQMDDLKGIQCEESNIATLRVMPSLDARRDGQVLHLSGEVPVTETISDAVALLTKAEPGLTVETSGVVVHPAVLPISIPRRAQDGADSPVLAKVWPVVNFAWPAIAFDLEELPLRLTGTFPDATLRDAVVAALKAARPDLTFEASDLKVDTTLPHIDFSAPESPDWQPPVWLASEWNRWHVFPALRLRQEKYDVKLDGVIPSQALLKNVIAVLHRLRPDLDFVKGNIQVRNGSLDKPLLLPPTLKDWTPPAWLRPVVTQVTQLPAKSAAAPSSPTPIPNPLMEPVWYFLSRAAATLIPLILIAFGAGLWAGWIKWHTWKREYTAVERDYHKLHDIHDVARATIPELEQRREALTGEIGQLEGLLGEYKDANEKFQAESERLNASLRATKRNYEALEEIWRVKLATADLRIQELEAALAQSPATPAYQATPPPAAPEVVFQKETAVSPETTLELDASPDEEKRLIPFPAASSDELLPLPALQPKSSPQKPGKKSKNRRAV